MRVMIEWADKLSGRVSGPPKGNYAGTLRKNGCTDLWSFRLTERSHITEVTETAELTLMRPDLISLQPDDLIEFIEPPRIVARARFI